MRTIALLFLPFALLSSSGCILGVGYTSGLGETAATRELESRTGEDVTGGGWVASVPVYPLKLAGEGANHWIIGGDLSWSGLPGDAGIFNVAPSVNYFRWDPQSLLMWSAGAGPSWSYADLPGDFEDSEVGAHARLGVDYMLALPIRSLPLLPLFAEVRYQYMDFDTPLGDIDGDRSEIVVGVRLHYWMLLAER
jgi:hypothetical protein